MSSKIKGKFKETEIGMIPEDWEVKSIDEVAEVVGGGTPSTKNIKYWDGDIAWITPKDLSNFKFRYVARGGRNITRKGLENSSAKLVPKGTVLLTTRAPVGYVAIAEKVVSTNQGFRSLIPKDNVKSEFLFYLLKKNVEILKSNASGTTFGELSGSRLKALQFAFPDIDEQSSIAKILSDLDSKIEINQQMNKTLEAIGQALFKHWFIDFEFPNEKGKPYKSSGGKMVDSELGEIPKGWTVHLLPDVCLVIDCLHTKKPEMVQEGPFLLQVYNIAIDGTLDFTEKYKVSETDYGEWTKNIEVKEGDCLITNAGRVGAVAQVPVGFKGGIGRNITAIRPNDVTCTYLFRYLFSSYGLSEIERQTDQGTVLDSLNVKGIRKIRILVPPPEIMDKFEKIARPLREKVERNKMENDSLMLTRDSLLPRLMSGKIRVPIRQNME